MTAGISAALPRSMHHLRLLAANGATPDIVLFRDDYLASAIERLFPGRAVALGREARPALSPGAVIAARRSNRCYYDRLKNVVDWAAIDRLILFLEGEPLERFVLRQATNAAVELWEDGLSHYVDLTGGLWYRMRAAAQLAAGFHPRGIFARRLDRGDLVVRDRFDAGDLHLPAPAAPTSLSRAVLLIGSPLVDDALIGARRFVSGLTAVAAASPLPVRYLPHPREDRARLAEIIPLAIDLIDGGESLGDHVARVGYCGYLSALSTGLLDIARPARSVFIPSIFGMHRAHRALAAWRSRPVAIAATPAALKVALHALAARPLLVSDHQV